MSNKIVIKSAHIEKFENKVRLVFNVAHHNSKDVKEGELWYEVNEVYEKALCSELIDGVLVTLLPYAMRRGLDIVSEIGMSEELYYNLTHHVIPQLCTCNEKAHRTQIKAPLLNLNFNSSAVAAGMSRGVDSFATLYEYTEDCMIDNYKITHLTYFENGALHMGSGENYEEMERLFKEQVKETEEFCANNGFDLIVVRSNLNHFLSTLLWVDAFNKTHTYRNIGTAMILQKLIKVYYYSSAYNLNQFSCNLWDDSASYEKYFLPHIKTHNFDVFSSNKDMNRIEKTRYISNFKSSYDALNVCFMGGSNCGKCRKCVRTMLTLDFLGVLDRYKNSFNVDYYKKNKKWYYTNLYYRKDDFSTVEILRYVKEHNIKIPLSCKIKGNLLFIANRAFFAMSKIKFLRKIAYKFKPY